MEKIMVANLKKTYDKPRTKRRRVVVQVLKEIAARHAKSEYYDVKVDNSVMKEIYKSGGNSPLKKIKVKLTKDEKTGIVLVTLAEAPMKKEKKPKEAKKAEKKEVKKEAAKKEDKKKPTEEKKQ